MSDLPPLAPITDPLNPTPTAVPAEDAYALTYTGEINGTVRTVQVGPNGTPSQILASLDRTITHQANRRGITLNIPESPTAQDIIPILRPVWKDPDRLAIVPAREYFTQTLQRLGNKDEAGNTTWRLALIPTHYSTASNQPGYVRYVVRAALCVCVQTPQEEPIWHWLTIHMGRRFATGKTADLSPHLSRIDFAAEVPAALFDDPQRLEEFRHHLMNQAPTITEQATAELERRYGLPTGSIIPKATPEEVFADNPFPFWARCRIRHIASTTSAAA